MTKVSVLTELVNGKLITETDTESAKKLCIDTIQNSSCFQQDARRMVFELNRFTNVTEIQKYIFNCYLKYQGLGTSLQKKWY